ncbi:zinc ribbon domain-containing protein [Halorarum halophilum]|uniref:Zinc ribbon domain-containing protein n=1 Tax=Halorarum halophilum TaxID=2743090 RepID=A0A7D5K1A1_9EURY|nr:zinc ribbon domain-containing protein [Halobaculum halophilum]QLG27681.1 zinc ribbon domain-containing protein [Halobaculum halophilum]
MSRPSRTKSGFHGFLKALVAVIIIFSSAAFGFLFLGPLGAMLGGLFGVYVATADQRRTRTEELEPDQVSCQECEADNVRSANYCQNCGVELETAEPENPARKKSNGEVYYCDKCGNTVPEESESCPDCGRELS